MDKLKPCPFCGRKMIISKSRCITADGEKTGYKGYCVNCGMQTRTKFSKAEAIEDTNRRSAPENKPLTVFGALTKSPEVFAEFIRKVNLGQILIDELFCDGDCGNDDCPHELQCIINWLNGPYAHKPEQEDTP